MKHLGTIQREFLKLAGWDNWSFDRQRRYLEFHPDSKRRITAKPKNKKISPHSARMRQTVSRMYEAYTPGEMKNKIKYEADGRMYVKYLAEVGDGDDYMVISLTEPEKGKIYFRETVNDAMKASKLPATLTNKDEAVAVLNKRFPNAAVYDESLVSDDKERVKDKRLLSLMHNKLFGIQNKLYTEMTPGGDNSRALKNFERRTNEVKTTFDDVLSRANKRLESGDDEHEQVLSEINDIIYGSSDDEPIDPWKSTEDWS